MNSLGKIELTGHIAYSCAFSADGVRLAIGCIDGTVVIHDVSINQSVGSMVYGDSSHQSKNNIISMHWSSCGQFLLTSNISQFVLVWSVSDSKALFGIKMHHQITKVRFHPTDTDYFIICMEKGPVKIAHRENKQNIKSIPMFVTVDDQIKQFTSHKQNPSYFLTAEFHPSGKYIFVTSSDNNINVIDTVTLCLLTILKTAAKSRIDKMCISQDGIRLAVSLKSCTLLIYDVTVATETTEAECKKDPIIVIEQKRENSEGSVCVVSNLCLSPDHGYLLLGYGKISFCDVIMYKCKSKSEDGDVKKEPVVIWPGSLCGVTGLEWRPGLPTVVMITGEGVQLHSIESCLLDADN